MVRLQINIPEELHEELRTKAFEKKISISGLIRSLLKFGNSVEKEVREFKETQKPQHNFSKDFHPVPKLGKKK